MVKSLSLAELQALWPCAAGCILGHGANCSNLRGRTHPLYSVCIKCGNGDEAYIRQTHERSDPDWVAKHPTPEAAKPDPEAAAKAQAGAALTRLAQSCLYRGDKLGAGCNCMFVCWAGAAGKGRFNSNTNEWEASLGDCVECVKALLTPKD